MRLRPKITIGILSILLLTLLIAGSFYINGEQDRYLGEIRTAGTEMASLVAQFCSLPIQRFSFYIVEEVARNVEASPQVAYCEIYDQNGVSLLPTETRVMGQMTPNKPRRTGPDVMVITHPITAATGTIGQVEIGFRLAPVHQQLRQHILRLAISIVVLLVVVALVINLFLSVNFISPVVALSQAARRLARGDFVETPMESRGDEIGGLARSFNQMSTSLKQLYQELELKVAERTAELETANRNLQQEIGDRRQAQAELRTAKEAAEQANAYKSTFIANVSHEIRTPLNAILGYSQILQRKPKLDDEVRRCINTIEGSGTHLLGLINDILDLSKIEAGKLEMKSGRFDLVGLVNDLGTMFELRCNQKALSWTVEGIDPGVPIHVSGDAGKLRQVLINLLDNALKFTASGGITLRVLPRDNDRYRFEVTDTGPGLDMDAHRMVFEPFAQAGDDAQIRGAGLGLAISQRFVELMGGYLSLVSTPGQGTSFDFEITLAPDAGDGPTVTDVAALDYRILPGESVVTAVVADDDADNRSYLSTVLRECGLTVHTAGNGAEALERVAEYNPDIIFLNHYMPVMNGPETVQRLRSQHGDASKIVLVSAAAFTLDDALPDVLAVDATLLKPFKVQAVFDCLANLLELQLVHLDPADAARLPSDVSLDPSLHKLLLEMAEFGQVSALKRIVGELEGASTLQPELSRRLRVLLNRYDLDGIVAFLRDVPVWTSSKEDH